MEFTGWVANLLFFSGGCFKSPRKTIAAYTTANVLYIILYLSLAMPMAAITMFITCIRSSLTLVLNDRQNAYSLIILTGILCLILLFNLESIYDLTILFATIFIGLSGYYRDHFYKFRIMTSISQILWIIHSLIFGVYPMLVCCFIILGTNIGAMLYYSNIKEKILRYIVMPEKV